MPFPTRVLLVLLTACLYWHACGSAGRTQTVGGQPSSDLSSLLQRLDQHTQRIEQLETENRRLSKGLGRLGEVPSSGVGFRPLGGVGKSFQPPRKAQAGTLWDAPFIWQPFIEGNFRGGGTVERGELDVFLPLSWSEDSLLFADLRGSLGDTGNHEGNWALAWRRKTADDRIVGLWGSYDLRESPTGNHFDQAAFGLEVLSLEKEFRFNGYVPTDLDPKPLPGGTAAAVLSGNHLVVRSDQEAAYWGLDGEFGKLLWSHDPCDDQQPTWYAGLDAELRAFVGGYYFDNPDAVFDQIAGPRVRSELRLYDLAVLGDGSRLTLEGLIQHDQLRDTQAEGGVYIRIPFGSGPRRRMDRLQRRMADRIVRDVDVVAQRQATDEAALFADSEFTVSSAHVVDAGDDLSDAVAAAGANSLVVLDGSAGSFSEGDTTTLSSGQVVLGGSGTLAVVGADTGAQVTFSAPGTRPQVTGTDTANDVFQIADDTVLAGLDIVGGNNGVYGDGVTGFTIRDLDVSGATQAITSGDTLYYADHSDNTIKRANLDGSLPATVVSSVTANEIALDLTNNKIYWSETTNKLIRRANLDGSALETIVNSNSGLNAPREVAVDATNSRLYWVDEGTEKIQSSNLDGTGVTDLVTDIHAPFGIDLDVAGNKMYWTSGTTNAQGNDKVQRANLDGSSVETLFFTPGDGLHGIALDLDGSNLYFSNILPGPNSIIKRANLNGSDLESVLDLGAADSRAISVDPSQQKMYFNDLITDTIQRASFDGSGLETIISSGTPKGLALDLTSRNILETGNGLLLTGTNNGHIVDSTFEDNDTYGVRVDTFNGGTISRNTASGSSYGFRVLAFNSGAMSDNMASGNTVGFEVAGESISIFSDDFDQDTPAGNGSLTHWLIENGTIDVNPAGDERSLLVGWTDNYGNIIDLDGSASNGALIRTKNASSLSPGTYRFQFDVSGSGRPSQPTDTFSYGVTNTFTESLTFSHDKQVHTVERFFTIDSNATETLFFDQDAAGDNFGIFIDNVQLSSIGDDGFSGANSATFGSNLSTNNTAQGYHITGTPASGSGTNTGSGNGSDDSF